MAIKIVVEPKVKFHVKGTLKDGAGVDQPFDFTLTCKRLDTEQQQKLKDEQGNIVFADFMASVIEDWSGVKGEDDKELPYSQDTWHALAKIPGVAQLAWLAYIRESGAKEKN